ncbi:ABC transporter permease [Massilia sp. W12]|uniref:ABC transporter permease n=1 Tax=Massilia sp. W12 TaxID=3126507 RepID=UPI0030CC0E84
MLQHPVNKVSYRSLRAEFSTYLFMVFAALIVSLFMVLQGVGKAQQGDVFSKDDRILVVSNKIAPRYPLPVRYAYEINLRELPGVERAVAVNFVPATMNGPRKQIAVMAANPSDILRTNTDLVVLGGAAQRWIDDTNGLLVGRDFATREGLMIGDVISITSPSFREAGGVDTIKLKIQGLYAVKNDAYPAVGVLLHDKLIRPNGQTTTAQGASAILVLLKDRSNAIEVAQIIDDRYKASPMSTRTTLREQFVDSYNSQGAGIRTLLRLYGLGGIAAGGMLLLAFCYFNAYRLEQELRRFEEMGFNRFGVIMRAATAMMFPILAGAAFGVVLTLLVSALFKVSIQKAFPYFAATWETGLPLLPAVAAITFLLSAFALLTVVKLQRRTTQVGAVQ